MISEKYLFRRQFILGPKFIRSFQKWKKISINKKLFLTIHPDLEVLKVTFKENIIVLLGYILDPYNPSFDNLKIINNIIEKISDADDIFQLIDSKCGRFIFIVKIKDELRIFNDAAGYRQIFYYRDDTDNLWCASQPSIIAEEFRIRTDPNIVEDFSRLPLFNNPVTYWYPGNITLYKDIFHLTPNHYLNLNSGEIKRYWPIKSLKPISIDKAVDRSSKILQGTFESACKRFNLALTVTAGYDCRVLLSACKMVKENIHFITHTHNNLDEDGVDIKIPKEMLRRVGLKHNIARHSNKVDEDFQILFKRNVTGSKESTERNAYAFLRYFQNLGIELTVAAGEVGGLGKSFYYLPSFFKVNGRALAALTGMKGSRTAEKAFGEWLESAHKAVCYGTNILDLLYWEMRLGNWSTLAISSYDIVFESLLPFNCRLLMEYLICVDKKYRLPPNYTHVHLIYRMWPELLEVLINPSFEKMENIMEKLRGKQLYQKLRFVKFLYHYLLSF